MNNRESNAKELHFGAALNLIAPAAQTEPWFLTIDNSISFPILGSQGMGRAEVIVLLFSAIQILGIADRFTDEATKNGEPVGEMKPICNSYYELMQKVAERIQILETKPSDN
jgi:hypothetical protein